MDDREQSMNTMLSGKDRLLLDLEGVYGTYWDAEVAMGALVLCRYGEDAFQFECIEGANCYAGGAPEASLFVHDHDVPRSLGHGDASQRPLRTLSITRRLQPPYFHSR